MAYYNKIGLLVLNADATKFLACEKDPASGVLSYILPGGKIEVGESDVACIEREMEEELKCKVDVAALEPVGEYIDLAADRPDRDVSIKLYLGTLIGEPVPSNEIIAVHWIGKDMLQDSKVSPIIRNKIMPDLVQRGILR
jgi:8-oxo-dGTP diphosphatase